MVRSLYYYTAIHIAFINNVIIIPIILLLDMENKPGVRELGETTWNILRPEDASEVEGEDSNG